MTEKKETNFLVKASVDDDNIDGGYAIVGINQKVIDTMQQMHSGLTELQKTIPDIYNLTQQNYSALFVRQTKALEETGLTKNCDTELIIFPFDVPDDIAPDDSFLRDIFTDCDHMVVTVNGHVRFESYLEDTSVLIYTSRFTVEEWKKAFDEAK